MPSFDLALFVPLLAAHLLSDFALQTDAMVRTKDRPLTFLLHILITGLCAYILLGDFSEWRIPLLVVATHGLVDLLKIRLTGRLIDDLPAFLFDQAAHLAVIFAISAIDWSRIGIFEPWWLGQNPVSYLQTLVVISGLIANTLAAGHFIAKALPKMLSTNPQQLHQDSGLNGAGRYIGHLERTLLLIFVYSGQLSAAGLLIAAKSVLRFQKANESRRETEYILVGTLLSFTVGIVLAFATKQLMQ
ncbi:DUF3307 domain-containing protein [Pelagicoccus sp. SDUM812002]|uniref:DUF3307 domain-containing protein n=1 Tax=Pelagicoccus sp. SDUM812002 TaxID=3041266 RepID=UPI0028101C7F|nr:DUF3307 domain-containing protein [Pelagicoccus sp. SDUM812002]MDQ8187357.1 DUF3307 domain-containing protein [Pelagicoccus sp. SDUM812002]